MHFKTHTEAMATMLYFFFYNEIYPKEKIGPTGRIKLFNDAMEGLIGGLIWKLKTTYPQFCTLPHLIAIYQLLNNLFQKRFCPINLSKINYFLLSPARSSNDTRLNSSRIRLRTRLPYCTSNSSALRLVVAWVFILCFDCR